MIQKLRKLFDFTRAPADSVKLYGVFGFRVFEMKAGRLVQTCRVQKKNQITNQGRSTVLNLLCPSTYAPTPVPPQTQTESELEFQGEHRIWSLAVGTNSTPPTVADDDTTMTKAWQDIFVFPAECQVIDNPPNDFLLSISKTLPLTEANGSTLTEAGIFTRGNDDDPLLSVGSKLYARQVHTPIIKTATMTIQYEWQLGITIQG